MGGAAAAACPNAAIRAEQGATDLADCRAYELVSPPGLDIGDIVRTFGVADDGNAAAWSTFVAGDDALGAQQTANGVGLRTATGWVNRDANLAIKTGNAQEGSAGLTRLTAHAADFSRFIIITQLASDPDDVDGPFEDLYRLDVGTGRASWVTHGTTLPDASRSFPVWFGGTPDLERNVFAVRPGGGWIPGVSVAEGLFVRDSSGIELVSVLPDGSPAVAAGAAAPASDYGLGITPGFEPTPAPHGGRHAVSDDATKIFFNGSPGLLLRDTVAGTTTVVSASQRSDGTAATHPALFIAASHDGDVVFFESVDRLTDAAKVGGGIYRFDRPSGSLALITPDAADPDGLEIEQAIVSDDASHVYFTSPRDLAPGGQEGAANIYVWSAETGTRFVASPDAPGLARVSRSGRYAVIATKSQLGGALNAGRNALYEYDDVSGELACASCRPDGSPSVGVAAITAVPTAAITPDYIAPRLIADDGRVFFSSTDRIVAADRTAAADVYEFDRGTVSLLTAGEGADDSYLADSSDSGDDVFVLSRSPFVAADRDPEELDLYDVRVAGGFPAEQAAVAPVCAGEECQGAAPPAPSAAWIGSLRAANARQAGSRRAAKPHVAKPKKALLGSRGQLSIRVRSRGELSLRGRGLEAGALDVATAGAYRLPVLLTAAAQKKLASKGSYAATAWVLFRAADGAKGATAVHLTFRGPATAGSR